ncbi:MAG: hypothetical protein R3F14_40435 [Polyangiaceae bacterium]
MQFPWDREGSRDDNSSCWMRVSQGWAGAGYGMIMIPASARRCSSAASSTATPISPSSSAASSTTPSESPTSC